MTTIGERIKEARGAVGLSQAELGLRVGVSQGAIAQYERGENYPAIIQAVPLAQALQVTTDWLLGNITMSLVDARRSLARLSEMALVSQLTRALEGGLLTGSQVVLLGGLVAEFSAHNSHEPSPAPSDEEAMR